MVDSSWVLLVSPVFRHLYSVSCILYSVSCILYPVSLIQSLWGLKIPLLFKLQTLPLPPHKLDTNRMTLKNLEMPLTKQKKTEIFKNFTGKENNTGSIEGQIAQ